MPEMDSSGNFVKIGYNELDTIRERRNKFVHSILNNTFAAYHRIANEDSLLKSGASAVGLKFDNENIMKLQKSMIKICGY